MPKNIETMRFKNTSSHTLDLTAIGLDNVEPGAEVDVPLYLAAPSRGDSGNRKPSPLESVAPQLQPASKEEHAVWKRVPPPADPISKIVSVNNNKAPGEPSGVRALRESLEKKNQEATKASTINVLAKGEAK